MAKRRSTADSGGKLRLNLDFDSLFPGGTVEIGDTSVVIKPLGIFQLATISKQVKGFGSVLAEQGVTWENYGTPESLFNIANTLLTQAPEVISEVTNIHVDDIKALPLDAIVLLIDKVLEVNLEAKDNLSKNFKSLAEKFQTIVATVIPGK